jgi:large subunit ribosomal protein L30e
MAKKGKGVKAGKVEVLVKGALKDRKLVIGGRRTIKGLKKGKVRVVVYASNCPAGKIKDLNHYGTLSNIDLIKFDGNSQKLGELCGKPFNAIIVGIKK